MDISIDFISAFQYAIGQIMSVFNTIVRIVEMLVSWGVLAPLFG